MVSSNCLSSFHLFVTLIDPHLLSYGYGLRLFHLVLPFHILGGVADPFTFPPLVEFVLIMFLMRKPMCKLGRRQHRIR